MFRFRALAAFGLSSAVLTLAAGQPDALRWVSYEEPAFPAQLLDSPVQSGFATLVFTFDDTGQIIDRIVVAASHPAFVGPLYEAARTWRVAPDASGRPVHRESIRFDFTQHSVVSLTHRDSVRSMLNPYGDDAAPAVHTYLEAELHPGLVVLTDGLPAYPRSLADSHAWGIATVNFIVDAEGRVRVPAVTSTSGFEFAASALAAVRRWRFSPPLRDGTPVQVMVNRTFRFGRGNHAVAVSSPQPIASLLPVWATAR